MPALNAPFGFCDTAYARLFYGLVLSLLFHVALIALVGGAQFRPTNRPLTAELRHIASHDAPPFAAPATRPELAPKQRLPPASDSATSPAPPVQPPKPAVDLPILIETYLAVDDVDTQAEPANDVLLTYPMVAYMQHAEGMVRINLFINEVGRLDRIDVIEASPTGVFEHAALEAVSKLYFHPATRFGRAVKSRKTIEVVFDLNPDHNGAHHRLPTPVPSATEK